MATALVRVTEHFKHNINVVTVNVLINLSLIALYITLFSLSACSSTFQMFFNAYNNHPTSCNF